jgi:hypothetical protein
MLYKIFIIWYKNGLNPQSYNINPHFYLSCVLVKQRYFFYSYSQSTISLIFIYQLITLITNN